MPELPEVPEPLTLVNLPDLPGPDVWLNLTEALRLLPWFGRTAFKTAADGGDVETKRTPGGHRRYLARHVHLMAMGLSAPARIEQGIVTDRSLITEAGTPTRPSLGVDQTHVVGSNASRPELRAATA